MSEPIINPMIFYWIDVLSWTKILTCVAFVILLVATIMIISVEIEEGKPFAKRKWLVIITFIFLFVAVLVPSESTMYKMLIAKYATIENIDIVINKIIQSINTILK